MSTRIEGLFHDHPGIRLVSIRIAGLFHDPLGGDSKEKTLTSALWADAQGFVFLSLMKAGLSTLIKKKPCSESCRVFSFVGVEITSKPRYRLILIIMDTQIQIFNNPQFGEIRTTKTNTGEPLFCLADACSILGLRQGDVRQRLDEGVVSTQPLMTPGGVQQANFINEDGLYDVILDSRKPEAKAFRKWVTSEVLPSIRKNGGYIVTKEDDTDESIMARALIIANNTIEAIKAKNKLLQEANTEKSKQIDSINRNLIVAKNRLQFNAPKIELADRIINSDKLFSFQKAAKILQLPFGRNILFKKLREEGVLMRGKANNNEPFQEYCERGYFEYKALKPIKCTDKVTGLEYNKMVFKTYVTGRGMFWLSKKFEGRNPDFKQRASSQLDLI